MKDYDGIEQYAGIVLKSSERALDLLINLMEWSRSHTGRMEFTPGYFELREAIDEVIRLLSDTANQKSIVIKKEVPAFAPVYADKEMIQTVLRNLVSNAIKFTEAGGEIVVTVKHEREGMMVSVRDNGVGIPEDTLGKIFSIGENYTTPGTNNEKGTGLGLILCEELVEKHGGRIFVDSVVGQGSRFYFSIPDTQNNIK